MTEQQAPNQEQEQIKTIDCAACQGAGWVDDPTKDCPSCQGAGLFQEVRGVRILWRKKIKSLPPIVRKSFNRTYSVIETALLILCVLCVVLGGFALFESLRGHDFLVLDFNLFFDIFFAGVATTPLWLGITLAIILYYHKFIYKTPEKISAENPHYSFILADDISRAKKPEKPLDISVSADPALIQVLRDALDLAFKLSQQPNALHLLWALVGQPEIAQVFLKLELPPKEFLEELQKQWPTPHPAKGPFALDSSYKLYLFKAFWEAAASQDDFLKPQHLLFVIVSDPEFKSILNKYGVSADDFQNIILWNRYKNLKNFEYLSKNSFKKPKHQVMNRAWTAVATRTLDQFSVDLTDYARVGQLFPLINRIDEMRMLNRILIRSSKNNVLLVGEEGAGRDALVGGLAQNIIKNKVSGGLFDKRVVKLNVGMLGTGGDGTLLKQRIEAIMNEVVHTQNVILYIPNIHELAKVKAFVNMDIISFLSPLFAQSVIQVIGSTTPKDYHDHIESRGEFAQTFDQIKINELSTENSLRVLSTRVPLLERENGAVVTYRAAEEAVKQSQKFITDRLLPQKALDILAEAIVRAKTVKGQTTVTENEVREVFSEKTGIPITKIKQDEADKLLNLEENLRKQVIGQEEAVKQVAASVRRSRVRVGEDERPISVFLFLGPTGVGKTELSKALANIYFGARDRMVRIDMSEFSGPYDLPRLIGDTEGEMTGLLTEPVKKNPFTLVLLDEFEKAHPTVWDIFLQVFDDGRITDGRGQVINFTNTILIATSNVGAKIILNNLSAKQPLEEIKPVLQKELLNVFRPEFINRFDDVIIFNALTKDNIKAIANLEINQLNKRVEEEQGVTIKLTDDALDYLAETGHSPEYGARFLKRTIREKIEDVLVVGILKGAYPRGSVMEVNREMLEEGKSSEAVENQGGIL